MNFNNITTQGWLQKRSRYLRSWKKRYVIVADNCIFTFKDSLNLKKPTEKLNLHKALEIMQDTDIQTKKNYSFGIRFEKKIFYFFASSEEEKMEWINKIESGKVSSAVITNYSGGFDENDSKSMSGSDR